MKKWLLFPALAGTLFIGLLTFNACQKEQISSPKEITAKGSETVPTKSCFHPVFYNKEVGSVCSDGFACSMSSVPTSTRNRIKWRVGTQCNSTDNFVGTSYYTLYKKTGTSGSYETYSQITTFNCTVASMFYAKTILTNSSTFILIVSDSSSPLPSAINLGTDGILYNPGGGFLSAYYYYSDFWKFSTGTGAGTPCGIIG